MAEMAVVLQDHSPATLHDEEGLVAGSGPHHGAGVVPPSCVRIEDADLVERVEPTCFFFLAGAPMDDAEEPAEEPVEGRRCRRQCGRRRCGRRDCGQVWIA
jgi:hypothetical protein